MDVAKPLFNGINGLIDMKCAESNVMEQDAPKTESVIHMPAGLLGFETVKNYVLLGSAEEAPFLWLQMAEEPELSFLVIEPSVAFSSYQPDISDQDAQFLGLENPEDALVLNIVTLQRDGTGTVDLKGPIMINRRTLVAKQVVPLNANAYSLHEPLPVMAAPPVAA